MSFKLSIHTKAERGIIKISKTEPQQIKKINKAILELQKNLFSASLWIKKLHDNDKKLFCVKVGKYRIKFEYKDNIILILEISPRKDAYK